MSILTAGGVRSMWDFIKEVFWFVAGMLIMPAYAAGCVIKDQVQQEDKPGWEAVAVGVVLIALTVATIACILFWVIFGLIAWWIAVMVAVIYLAIGACLVLMD